MGQLLTQGVKVIHHLLRVHSPFLLSQGKQSCKASRACSRPPRARPPGLGLGTSELDQNYGRCKLSKVLGMGVGLWPGQQRGCWELGVNLGAWGPGFRGAPFTSICRTLDTASPTGNSKDPRATTFRDTAAAVVGTTEKPTGRAEPAGTSTCWASPPPPGRHSPSTGDTWTLTWGQEDGDGQGTAR